MSLGASAPDVDYADDEIDDGVGPSSGRTHASVASRGVALRGVGARHGGVRASSLDVESRRSTAATSQSIDEATLAMLRDPPGGDFHTHEYDCVVPLPVPAAPA